ncbi:MAG: hypothetical protein QF890_16225 [Myxococcota bacterium]|jgi:hypothetical protein|nr:hypothetical protein [Deltaproteobacteria bacterium]MCP4245220.1 hypothetical protein [bacterium]MDP7074353.1 hypothetical protein [Myxococcota bacterium]MDP7300509.1 hypothetical protein [Myxococcota bacterium]MDP7434106.1 hypothetical protein [Myxococcota bacterium]
MASIFSYSNPPIQLDNVIEDLDAVVGLLERNAPYTPLGGWFRPDHDGQDATSPMWFQKTWMGAEVDVEGSELFVGHERVQEAVRQFYGAEVVVPHTLFVNLMAAIPECGPVHTDNPLFRGRDRMNTPMLLLRTMFWSRLFDEWATKQATSIWWMNDVEGGGIAYWPEGPEKPPQRHVGAMANTSLVGDNHGMFHQVEPVGPFLDEPLLVSTAAELAPASDGSGDWVVMDRGVEAYRAPLDKIRVSVLWKSHVFSTEEERRRVENDTLSFDDVARIFNEDLAKHGKDFRFDISRVDDPDFIAELRNIYPEPVPIGTRTSVFDVYS